MSLLPKSRQIQDALTPLGKLVAREIAPVPDKAAAMVAFEKDDHHFPLTERAMRAALMSPLANTSSSSGVGLVGYSASFPATSVTAVDAPRFRRGDRVRSREPGNVRSGAWQDCTYVDLCGGWHMVTNNALPGNPEGGFFLQHLELIAPPATLEVDGWTPYKKGDIAPMGVMKFMIRWTSGKEIEYENMNLTLNDDLRTWDSNSCSKVVAYKVIKP